MSKRKKQQPERRRAQIEINLLADEEEKGGLPLARRGCSLPFLGGVLAVLGLLVSLRTLAQV